MIIKADLYSELYERMHTWTFTINEENYIHSIVEQINSEEVLDFLGHVNSLNFEKVVKMFLDGMNFENYRIVQ